MSARAVAAPAGEAPPPVRAEPSPEAGDGLYVCAVDLPTASLAKARAAVALQLDLISPLPVAEVVSDTVLVGPVEGGLTRWAVGLAPRTLFVGPSAPAVRLSGRLDGQSFAFRFENPLRAGARAAASRRRLDMVLTALAAAALVLGGLTLRLGREIAAAEARAEAASDQARQAVARARGGDGAAWLADRAANAPLVGCALRTAGAARLELSELTVAGGAAALTPARPLADDALAALPDALKPAATGAGPAQLTLAAGACK